MVVGEGAAVDVGLAVGDGFVVAVAAGVRVVEATA